jgi:hypothetical protein
MLPHSRRPEKPVRHCLSCTTPHFPNPTGWSARIAELDELAAYRQLGFSSLFDLLHREIGLSRGSACHREVEEPVRDGRLLCITTVGELAKVMTEENRAVVLPGSSGARGRNRRPRASYR